MNSDLICSVNSNGSSVALCTSDGVIKFYDTLTSNFKQEYSSSTHLQASCNCLAWSKSNRLNSNKNAAPVVKSKKSKTSKDSIASIENELKDLELIAIGTSQGSILLYSLTKAALHSEYSKDGHVDKVNDIAWCSQFKDSLYSCSEDGHIIEWSIIESKTRHKWKASKTPVTAISVDPTSKYLTSSSKTITIWDLETRTKLKNLTGHSNDIFSMLFLNNSLPNLFLSAAQNDRVLNMWSTTIENNSNAAVSSFTINDGPVYIDLACIINNSENNEQTVLILAVTTKGNLFIYKHIAVYKCMSNSNKKMKKPVKASHQISMQTNENNIPLPILGAFVTNSFNERLDTFNADSELSLYIVYGSHVNPIIEKLKLSELNENKISLKRDDPFKTKVSLQTQATKIETPSVSKELKVLVPGYMAPQSNNNLVNKRKTAENNEMTLEERLNVMGIDSKSNGDINDNEYLNQGQIPKADNLLVLLVQGLQSNDAKMLNHVLQHKNEKVVAKTVRMLPSNHIISLVRELNKRLQGHAQGGIGIVKWLKCVLMIHTSFLMSYPDLVDSLGSIYEMMNARTKLFPQLSKLQGKLQLVMSQVTSQAEALNQNSEDNREPFLLYQDSNSEDEQFEEELIPSHSEFDEYLLDSEEDEDVEDEDLENENGE